MNRATLGALVLTGLVLVDVALWVASPALGLAGAGISVVWVALRMAR